MYACLHGGCEAHTCSQTSRPESKRIIQGRTGSSAVCRFRWLGGPPFHAQLDLPPSLARRPFCQLGNLLLISTFAWGRISVLCQRSFPMATSDPAAPNSAVSRPADSSIGDNIPQCSASSQPELLGGTARDTIQTLGAPDPAMHIVSAVTRHARILLDSAGVQVLPAHTDWFDWRDGARYTGVGGHTLGHPTILMRRPQTCARPLQVHTYIPSTGHLSARRRPQQRSVWTPPLPDWDKWGEDQCLQRSVCGVPGPSPPGGFSPRGMIPQGWC